MKHKNSKGARTEPRGTPEVTLVVDSIVTRGVL